MPLGGVHGCTWQQYYASVGGGGVSISLAGRVKTTTNLQTTFPIAPACMKPGPILITIWLGFVPKDPVNKCLTAPSHYPIQCWPRSVSPYSFTGPQWVNGPFVRRSQVCYNKMAILEVALMTTLQKSATVSSNLDIVTLGGLYQGRF